MRKIGLLLLLVWIIPGAIATAAPPDDLADLARYYPADTLIFGSVRTDDGFVDVLDELLVQAAPFSPDDVLSPDFSLRAQLDAALADNALTYDAVRAWLGDTAAIGLGAAVFQNMDASAPSFYAAIALTDKDAALAFFEPLLQPEIEDGYGVVETIGSYTVYRPADDDDVLRDPSFAFGDDVLFVGFLNAMPLDGVSVALSDVANFQDALAQLPAESYNLFAYVDTAAAATLSLAALPDAGGAQLGGLTAFITEINNAIAYQAIGATVLAGSALTIDMVQAIDFDALADLGFGETPIFSPVDLAFASRVPADAPLVILGSDFGAATQASFDQLRSLSASLVADGGFASLLDPEGTLLDAQERALLRAFDPFGLVIGATNVSFAGLTGLSLERDVLPVLDGASALYLRPLPADEFLAPVVPDVGLILGTSDTAAAQGIVSALIDAAEAYEADYPVEAYGDGEALVLPLLRRFGGIDYAGLDLMIGAADGVLALGTRPAVESALDTAGGLASDETFLAAQAHFLPDSQQVLYANLTPVLALVDQLALDGALTVDEDLAALRQVASILQSASITSTTDATGNNTVRFVLSLAEDPTAFPDGVEILPSRINNPFEILIEALGDSAAEPTVLPTENATAVPTDNATATTTPTQTMTEMPTDNATATTTPTQTMTAVPTDNATAMPTDNATATATPTPTTTSGG